MLVVAIQAIAIAIGLGVDRWTRAHVDALTRAKWRIEAGDRRGAERLLWDAMQQQPLTSDLVMTFLANHELMSAPHADAEEEDPSRTRNLALEPTHGSAIGDRDIERRLRRSDVPHDVAVLGLFRLQSVEVDEEMLDEIVRRASSDPPMPWANHLLALEAQSTEEERTAIDLLLREGTLVPGHEADVDAALWKLEESRDWQTMREKLGDPRVAAAASPWLKANVALRSHAIGGAFGWSIVASYPPPKAGPLLLALVAAVAWFVFCARLGRLGERPAFRLPLYLIALALGVASIVPTTFLIAVEEAVLHLVPNGTPGRDLVFYVLGVGFREELSKLLLFAPLVLVLRKRGTPLDVLVCGALVGLGFALVENLEYFARGDLSTAMARFLTANFLHMAMTGITAHALDDLVRAKEDRSFDASRSFLLVVLLHGAYDFFLTSHVVQGASYAAMLVFFILTRWFVIKVVEASPARSRPAPLVAVFAVGIALVVATSFVYGCALVGPGQATLAMIEGLLGLGIVAILFVRQLRMMES